MKIIVSLHGEIEKGHFDGLLLRIKNYEKESCKIFNFTCCSRVFIF